tara:strand:+ start:5900 stop:7549 length:1650 start_codon:yes stop_codon:yes gene_type:complete
MEVRDTQIILYQKNDFWISILESEGIPFQIIKSINELQKNFNKKVLILWQRINYDEFYHLSQWVGKENVIITKKEQFIKFKGENRQTEKFNFSKIDFSFIENIQEGNFIDYLQSSIHKGLCIGLFSDIDKYWSNTNISYKKICIDINKKIYTIESLNKIVKYNIRQYIRNVLLRSVQHFNHPLIYIWRFPKDMANVCNLRIDVDPDRNSNSIIAQKRINKTFELAKGSEDRTTFMVNFYKRIDNLYFINQYKHFSFDIQNHGYFHCLYPTFRHNLKNFDLAHMILKNNGINPVGFTCPEYFWYNSTRKILENYNYIYSHSFGLDYNNYPYRPVIDGTVTNYLEIPNDPLVFSKLEHAYNKNISPEKVSEFYLKSLTDKISTYDIPCIKYEHPAILGKYPIIIDSIYSLFNELDNVMPVTLTQWAKWLHRRNRFINNVSINHSCNENIESLCLNVNDNTVDLAEFGIAFQYDKDNIYVKHLEPGYKNRYDLTDFRKYTIKKSETFLNNIIFQKNEKKIDIFHSKKHLKKIISSYMLYFKYNKERFYVNQD